MNPAEALSRAGAKSQSYGDRIDSDFLDGLSWQEVIGLCQGLDEIHFSLMMGKYGLDPESLFTVKSELMVMFHDDFRRLKKRYGAKKDLLSGLVVTVMEDVISPHICPECTNGWVIPLNDKGLPAALPYECNACGGTGKRNLTPPQLAKIADLTWGEFNNFNPLYKKMVMRLQEVEAESIRHMKERYEKDV